MTNKKDPASTQRVETQPHAHQEAIRSFFNTLDTTAEKASIQLDFIFLNALSDEDCPPRPTDFLLFIELKKLLKAIEPIAKP